VVDRRIRSGLRFPWSIHPPPRARPRTHRGAGLLSGTEANSSNQFSSIAVTQSGWSTNNVVPPISSRQAEAVEAVGRIPARFHHDHQATSVSDVEPELNLKTRIQYLQKPTKKTKSRHLEPIGPMGDAPLGGDPPQANERALIRCFFVTFASFCKIQLVFFG